MLKKEIYDRLLLGFEQFKRAEVSASTRIAISEAYSSIDNFIYAILLENNLHPVKNHKSNLDKFLSKFPSLLDKTGFVKSDLEDFYHKWINIRYSYKFNIKSRDAMSFVFRTEQLLLNIIDSICTKNGIKSKELEDKIYKETIGGRWLAYQKETALVHEIIQHNLEVAGELGFGSKLGNKLVNPSNFSTVFLSANDKITKDIIANDEEIADKIADIYKSFIQLIDSFNEKRLCEFISLYGEKMKNSEVDNLPNYNLTLNFNYLGITFSEITETLINSISYGFFSLSEEEKKEIRNSIENNKPNNEEQGEKF